MNTILPMGNLCEYYCSIEEFENSIVRMSWYLFILTALVVAMAKSLKKEIYEESHLSFINVYIPGLIFHKVTYEYEDFKTFKDFGLKKDKQILLFFILKVWLGGP